MLIDTLFSSWAESGIDYAHAGIERKNSPPGCRMPIKNGDDMAERLADFMQQTKPGRVALITLLVHHSMIDKSREERSIELARLIGGPAITQSRYYQLLREAKILASDSYARLTSAKNNRIN